MRAQPGHLRGELLGLAAIPAVGQQDDERAAADPAAVLAVERRRATRRSACRRTSPPRARRRAERAVGVAAGELARDPRQPRAEGERLDPRARRDARLHVLEQHARVGRHRARDVEHEHEPPRPLRRRAPAALEQLAAVAQRAPRGRPQVGHLAAPPGRPRPAAEAHRPAPREPRQQPPRDARARRPCTRRSRVLAQQLRRRSTRPASARSPARPGAVSSPVGTATRGSTAPGDLAQLGERVACRRTAWPPNTAAKAARRRRWSACDDAQRRAQGVDTPARASPRRRRPAPGGRPAARRRRRARRSARSAAASVLQRPVTAAPGAPARHAPWSTPRSRTRSMSSRTFSATPSVASRSVLGIEREQRPRPRDRLPHARHLVELLARAAARPPRTPGARSPPARRAAARARSPPRARGVG